ncbi:MAG: hypothetical protein Q9M29_00620, partial [Mariprofundaceae bacterium]|nr:hypothetical protein [Mariprofundaceae bacterium]
SLATGRSQSWMPPVALSEAGLVGDGVAELPFTQTLITTSFLRYCGSAACCLYEGENVFIPFVSWDESGAPVLPETNS